MAEKWMILGAIICLWAGSVFAQIPEDLPRYETLWEKIHGAQAGLPGSWDAMSGLTDPPDMPGRPMAEWEELQALLITWRSHPAILTEIVRAAREECRVIILCENQSTVSSAQNSLNAAGVDWSSNVEFLITPTNSIWIRDYGPNSVYAGGVDSLYFVDWIYNRPTRLKDDTIATTVAPYLGVPLYATSKAPNDLVHTGGNFMSDGLGTGFSSRLVLEENKPGNSYGVSPKTEDDIDEIMYRYMGVGRYIKMTPLPYDQINHIDMHMKLLDEETLLVGQYPEGIADGPQIEANIQYVLSNFTSPFGAPYKVKRILMPPGPGANQYPNTPGAHYRTYANSVIVNKTIIVPFYEQRYDTTARRIWEEAKPGYKIVGINCNAIIPSLGAIHCITKEVGVADPLLIVHQQIPSCQPWLDFAPGYVVWANIFHKSGIASAKIVYANNPGGPWQEADLPNYMLDDTTFSHLGFIPPQPPGSMVYYYIEATAKNGKTITRPMTAPAGYWSFCVDQIIGLDPEPQVAMQAVFPNPASAITCIPIQSDRATRGALLLYDALGRPVDTLYDGEIPAGEFRRFLFADRYPPGVYTLSLETAQGRSAQKMVIR